MNNPFEVLDPEELAVYKWQYGLHGDFKKSLWNTIKLADSDNLDNLALGFPVDVAGYKKFAWESGWWDSVEEKIVR